jgi:acyl carrier protein
MKEWLLATLSERLGVSPSELDASAPLKSYGLSSLQAVAISTEIGAFLGRDVSPILLFQEGSVESLVAELSGVHEQTPTPDVTPHEPIAIF